MRSKNKIVGILGGIGPESTGRFYLSLINKLKENKQIKSNEDFPQIIINSIPAAELIYAEASDRDLQQYILGLKELEKFDVNFIVMVCNTIHLFYERLQKKIGIPIVNLREEVRRYLLKKKIKSAIVLGTPMTIRNGLYKFTGIKYIDPDETEINLMAKSIFDFNKGFERDKQHQLLKSITDKYLSRGVDIIILGCTELALILEKENIPKINTLDVLLETTVKQLTIF